MDTAYLNFLEPIKKKKKTFFPGIWERFGGRGAISKSSLNDGREALCNIGEETR